MAVPPFNQIVAQHKQMVYTICLRIAGSRENALEASQNAFIKVYENLNTFRGESKLSTWIYRIAYHEAIAYKRKYDKNTQEQDIESMQEYSFQDIASSLTHFKQEERKKYIHLALSKLAEEDNLALTLFYLQEQSIEEVAQIMNISQTNVKVRLHRGRKKLHEELHKLLHTEMFSLL